MNHNNHSSLTPSRTAKVYLVSPLWTETELSQQLGYRQSMEDLDQAKRQVALDIRQAFLNIELYSRSIEAQRIAVSAAEESYKLAQERYDLGTGTHLERLQAQSALFAARSDLVQAQFNYHIQLAQLDQAMGAPAAR